MARSLLLTLGLLIALWAGPPAVRADTVDPWDYDTAPPELAWPAAVKLPQAHALARGEGVTVAVLDTGVARHPDLGNRVTARVDLSADADGEDHYGHGAHMIGLVAGDGSASGGRHVGAAPAARVISVKVASPDGAADVSSVLAGLEWIAAHRQRYGIRVVSLSYGTDAGTKVTEDPLNFAVRRLTRAGVVVVAAAGNRGDGGARIDKPGDDPSVITVGAADLRGTASPADDVVAPFSSRGPTQDGEAKPDLVAPGISLVSHRVAGSLADTLRPEARVDTNYFKGSGSSQSTAIVAGVAALMLQAAPVMKPAEVKAALVGTAHAAMRGQAGAGAGLVNVLAAVRAARARTYGSAVPPAWAPAAGRGSLDASRGSFKPYAAWKQPDKPEQLSGEVDYLGRPWDAAAYADRATTPAAWRSGPWAPYTVTASGWADMPVPARTWPGLSTEDETWTIRRWSESPFTIRRWSSEYWVIRRWSTSLWHGVRR